MQFLADNWQSILTHLGAMVAGLAGGLTIKTSTSRKSEDNKVVQKNIRAGGNVAGRDAK